MAAKGKHTAITIALTFVASLCYAARQGGIPQDNSVGVSAVSGRQWGIASYRVTRTTPGPLIVHIIAELVNLEGDRIGEFDRARRFRGQFDADLNVTKLFRIMDESRLVWSRETLEIETDSLKGTFRVRHNGHDVGVATILPGRQEANSDLLEFTQTRKQLFDVASDVGRDLDRLSPDPPTGDRY